MTLSVGMIINYSQYGGKNQSHDPNHQPDNSGTIVGLIMVLTMVIMVNYYISADPSESTGERVRFMIHG